jgi:predicted chitinase
MLATTHHETAFTIQPVTEYGSIKYLKAKPYYPYVGRGYCQLTWDYNYTKAGKATDEDLLNFPETALNADVACTVMYEGMTYGWFTGKKLSDYFNETRDDPVNARRIINGLDRAKKIATYHKQYLHAIRSALQPI